MNNDSYDGFYLSILFLSDSINMKIVFNLNDNIFIVYV